MALGIRTSKTRRLSNGQRTTIDGLPVVLTDGNVYFVNGTDGNNNNDGKSIDSAKATITAGLGLVTDLNNDIIFVAPGFYNETVTVNKSRATLVGLGGRGATAIQTATVGAEGMQVTAPDVTLINIGVEAEDTADYALNVHGNIGVHADGVRRFRAFGCKFEGPTGTVVLLDGDADDNVGDVLFDDCEFAWGGTGLLGNDSGFGVPTQIFVKNSRFHNLTAVHVSDGDAWFSNIHLIDSVFDTDEAGAEPTDYILLDHANSSGIVSGCRFATATNAAGILTIGAQIMWVANATEAGWSTARPI